MFQVLFGAIAKATDWKATGIPSNLLKSNGTEIDNTSVVLPLCLQYLTPPVVSFFGLGKLRHHSKIMSRSPHMNNQYESRIFAKKNCLFNLWVNIGKIKVLNYGQNTLKNANITLYTKKNKNTLQHLKLGKLKVATWNIGCSMS